MLENIVAEYKGIEIGGPGINLNLLPLVCVLFLHLKDDKVVLLFAHRTAIFN